MKTIIRFLTFWIVPGWLRKRCRWRLMTCWHGRHAFARARKIGIDVVFRGPCVVNAGTSIGNHVVINGLSVQGCGECAIGDYVQIAPEVLILTSNHDYDGDAMIPYGYRDVAKKVTVGDFVWIGQRVTILPGVTIGEGAVIQAGAVVHGSIPPYAIAGGNPAKVFSSRNTEHFRSCKEAGCVLTYENGSYCIRPKNGGLLR